jgi:hypothetical protein
MKVGILGSREVAQSLANGFLALGHEVMLGSRESGSPAASQWTKGADPRAKRAVSSKQLILANSSRWRRWAGRRIEMAGPRHFDGKLVWDVTNPLDFSQGMPPKLVGGLGSSAGKTISGSCPKRRSLRSSTPLVTRSSFVPSFKRDCAETCFSAETMPMGRGARRTSSESSAGSRGYRGDRSFALPGSDRHGLDFETPCETMIGIGRSSSFRKPSLRKK